MTLSVRSREALVLGLLAVLPALAHLPAWSEDRLLGPGDGAMLHYPLRAAVWESYRERGELPGWNPWIFCGMPLLAGYRAGALYPLMVVLSWLPSFAAFQLLVLASLAASGLLLFVYLRRLGATLPGAYLSGLCFCLGPYLVGHLDDTPTVVAAPMLPLLLLAAEAYVRKAGAGRAAGLAASVALLLLAGSPEAARAGGALVLGRLLIGHLFPQRDRRLSAAHSALWLAAGVLLASPQLLPALLAGHAAGRQVTGLAATGAAVPGVTGLILRYVSHTPAPSLALAALPLVLTETPIRVLGVALALCSALQWGRGPLAAPGALALVFDLTLAIVAGLSLSAQWELRRDPLGRRLRAYFLFACLAAAAALSVSAVVLGPLPQTLAAAVGILALSLILYFSLAGSPDPLIASLWLLPLTVSFTLQPHGREIWATAPTRAEMTTGTPTRESLESSMATRRPGRVLTLAREWPEREALDLAFGNLGALAGRRSATGYDPMVPMRNRLALDGVSVGGLLPGAFFRSDPARLEVADVRWLQLPASALTTAPDPSGFGDDLEVHVDREHPRLLPVPLVPVTAVRIVSLMSDAVDVPQDLAVARVVMRLASGRGIELVLQAGRHTGEWAYDRLDVRQKVAHERPPLFESWPAADGHYQGHRYLGVLPLPGRYIVDGLLFERLAGGGRLTVARVTLVDSVSGRTTPLALPSAFVSDTARFRETAVTPAVRLYELPGAPGHAHVVEELHALPDAGAVLVRLRQGHFDPRREAFAAAADVAGVTLPPGARASRAQVRRAEGGQLELQAEGPGLLVVAESWDPGWTAQVDEAPARLLRLNGVQMGLVLDPGFHHVALAYRVPGLGLGVALAALGALAIGALALQGRRI